MADTDRGAPFDEARLAVAIVFTLAVLVVASRIAPHLHLGDAAIAFVSYGGAASLAVVSLALGTPKRLRASVAAVAFTLAAAWLVVAWRTQNATLLSVFGVDTVIVVAALSIGASIGTRVEHAGHLLPAGLVAAAADIGSVVSPSGPTHAIAASARALSVLAISFPVPGTVDVAPALGAGDLVFMALVFGVARVHAMPYLRTAVAMWVGVMAAGLLSGALEMAVPALPMVVAAVLIAVPQTRVVRAKERSVTRAACAGAVIVAVGMLLRGYFGARLPG